MEEKDDSFCDSDFEDYVEEKEDIAREKLSLAPSFTAPDGK